MEVEEGELSFTTTTEERAFLESCVEESEQKKKEESREPPRYEDAYPLSRSASFLNDGHGSSHWSVPLLTGTEAEIFPENGGKNIIPSCPYPLSVEKSSNNVGFVKVSIELPIGAEWTISGRTHTIESSSRGKEIRTRIRKLDVSPKLSPQLAIYANEKLPWSNEGVPFQTRPSGLPYGNIEFEQEMLTLFNIYFVPVFESIVASMRARRTSQAFNLDRYQDGMQSIFEISKKYNIHWRHVVDYFINENKRRDYGCLFPWADGWLYGVDHSILQRFYKPGGKITVLFEWDERHTRVPLEDRKKKSSGAKSAVSKPS